MKTKTNSIRAFVLGPAVLAAAVGLALTTAGCVVDTGPNYGYGVNCQSDLYVPWQIENPAGGPVTCDAAGAATVVIDVDGTKYPQTCPPALAYGSQDILLQANYATYDVTVNLYDQGGNALAVPQTVSVNVQSCGSYTTPGAATLVVTPPAQ
ncbi:MAG TPA: hypothetical protein VKZ18_07840 [Polyangia bacterium]|nr:hypothetical protein [Polyangia bacterium]